MYAVAFSSLLGNFLYDSASDTLQLLDFGAAKEYNKSFVDKYIQVVHAAAEQDLNRLFSASVDVGMLTGDESQEMLRAHERAGLAMGEPFSARYADKSGLYDWAKQDSTRKVGNEAKVFLESRLTPPPPEVYSLHRRLSGAYTMCIMLHAKTPCRKEFVNIYSKYN